MNEVKEAVTIVERITSLLERQTRIPGFSHDYALNQSLAKASEHLFAVLSLIRAEVVQ